MQAGCVCRPCSTHDPSFKWPVPRGSGQSDCSGCQLLAGAGGLTGPERTVGRDLGLTLPRRFAGYEELCRPSSARRCSRGSSAVIVICFHLR